MYTDKDLFAMGLLLAYILNHYMLKSNYHENTTIYEWSGWERSANWGLIQYKDVILPV